MIFKSIDLLKVFSRKCFYSRLEENKYYICEYVLYVHLLLPQCVVCLRKEHLKDTQVLEFSSAIHCISKGEYCEHPLRINDVYKRSRMAQDWIPDLLTSRQRDGSYSVLQLLDAGERKWEAQHNRQLFLYLMLSFLSLADFLCFMNTIRGLLPSDTVTSSYSQVT